MSDFQHIFNSVLPRFKTNSTQKTFKHNGAELAFINIADNSNANDIANSLGACDIRYVNECNMFSSDTIEKLRINNREKMFFDFNPYREFWIKDLITDNNFLKTTWKDNPFLKKTHEYVKAFHRGRAFTCGKLVERFVKLNLNEIFFRKV